MPADTANNEIHLDELYARLQRIGTHFSFTSHGEPVVTGPLPDALRGPNHKAIDILNELSDQLGISKSGLGLALNRHSNQFTLTFYHGMKGVETVKETVKLLAAMQAESQPAAGEAPAKIQPDYLGQLQPTTREKGAK